MTPESAIAHYRITGKLGEGGMGAVYRATDTKLGRDVAIKILPEAFAHDADRMARFEREARVLATLNHPNIAAIYGVEERALVMELVEGETLTGPLPIEEALPVGRQIAEALEYAHEKGIIHRDLKPANIKVTPEGRVKILDFGLAKAFSSEATAGDPASSPTLTMRATLAGVIMGTAAYMSPEQARGGAVDKRADIWSFGVVLYELLTGRQLFAGDTVSDTLAAVLKTDPDWSVLPPGIPPAIRRLLRRCLERDRKRRMRDIGDALAEIDEALVAQPESQPAITAVPSARGIRPLPVVILGLLFLAGLAIALIHFREKVPEAHVMRFQIPVDQSVSRLALSPDGLNLAYIAPDSAGRPQLWNRTLKSVDARMLNRTDQDSGVFWSADSRSIAFVADNKLKRIDAAGGAPQTLCGITGTIPGGTWNREGVILFGSLPVGGGIYKVSQAGGDAVQVTDMEPGISAHAWPQFLPDGRHFIYFSYTANIPDRTAIYLGELGRKQGKRLMASLFAGAYAAADSSGSNGHLLFLHEGTLMAQVLDSRSFELVGEAFPVAEQVSSSRSYGFFSASAAGVLAYRPGGTDAGVRQLQWFDRSGKELDTLGPPGNYRNVSLSPDGRQAAVQNLVNGNEDLYLVGTQGSGSTRFTEHPAADGLGIWSPTGDRIYFGTRRDGPLNIYQKASNGGSPESPLLQSELAKWPNDVSPDGRLLLYGVHDPKTLYDLWFFPLGGEGKAEPFLQTPFYEYQGRFSPPGAGPQQLVAFSSDESGTFEIYVQPFPAGLRSRVSQGGGREPRWRRDGKELFYFSPSNTLMSAEVKTAPRFEVTNTRVLFQTRIFQQSVAAPFSQYDVAPGGDRFLMITTVKTEERSSPITVVLNWRAGIGASSGNDR